MALLRLGNHVYTCKACVNERQLVKTLLIKTANKTQVHMQSRSCRKHFLIQNNYIEERTCLGIILVIGLLVSISKVKGVSGPCVPCNVIHSVRLVVVPVGKITKRYITMPTKSTPINWKLLTSYRHPSFTENRSSALNEGQLKRST
jgi:hypothetical protein